MRGMLQRIGTAMAKDALAAAVVEVEDYIANQAGKHTKSGALVQSIFKTKMPDGSWVIEHDLKRAKHALFVHWGTKAHLIKPKNKKTLRWVGGGVFHFAKVVHHPGNKPDKWMERAASIAPITFERFVSAKLRELQAS